MRSLGVGEESGLTRLGKYGGIRPDPHLRGIRRRWVKVHNEIRGNTILISRTIVGFLMYSFECGGVTKITAK